MPIYFKSIRNKLVLLVLLMILPVLVGVLLYALWEQRREARFQAQEAALRIARLAAREQEGLITGTHHLLMTLAALPEVRGREAAECNKLFAGIMKKFPHYTNVAAVTPHGDIFCSGLPNYSRSPNIADRAYFQEAVKERRLGISHVMVGRMSGKPNISIAYPSLDPDGSVHAVVFAGLDLGWLNSIAASADMPPGATLLAVDENGVVFVRYPEPEKWVGKSIVAPLVKTIIEQKEGSTEVQGPDGVPRLYGFTTLHRSSKGNALFVSVGIPKEVAFASSTRIFYVSLAAFLLASLLAAAATGVVAHLFIRRRPEMLLAAARELGEVDMTKEVTSSPRFALKVRHIDQMILEEMRLSLNKVTGRQSDFAAMIAHDLRNPIQTIDNIASVLTNVVESKEQEHVLTNIIRTSCKEMANLVTEFLDFSKFRSGYLELTNEEIDLREFLNDIYLRYALRGQQRGIALKLTVQPGIGIISADHRKLEQLLENLLGNALKFTGEDGEIEIGAQLDGNGTHIWVRDTGVGIGSEEMQTLFSKYRQGPDARKSDNQGTGLGLLICKMIAEGHGGRIWGESELNKGTTFHIWIPNLAADYRLTGTE